MPEPLSRRTILRHHRLRELISILARTIVEQPNAGGSPLTLAVINEMHFLAQKVFARMAGQPRFAPLPETTVLTGFDMRLLLFRLNATCSAFERHHGYDMTHPDDDFEEPEPEEDTYEGFDPVEVERFLAEDDAPPPRRRTDGAAAPASAPPHVTFGSSPNVTAGVAGGSRDTGRAQHPPLG